MSALLGPHRMPKGEDTWLTPPWLLEALGHFDLDPCCPLNMPWRTADRMLTPEDDGLAAKWSGRVWLNPPYGKGIDAWILKMKEHGKGLVLCFARTDTRWAQEALAACDGVLFIKGRLAFHHGDGTVATSCAGAPSMLLAFGEFEAEALCNSFVPGYFYWNQR